METVEKRYVCEDEDFKQKRSLTSLLCVTTRGNKYKNLNPRFLKLPIVFFLEL